ncbi:GatB/YqeY domain-containing protein [Tepidicaulis sp. LMO-SS28]|uniref:GatB/YqeY domain-containing protein n=1 Tax=Tepidicaulis sp. LMO-SS28 TaxID=3447455 RepID=UPI003EE2855D
MRERIGAAFKEAMKAQEKRRVATLRLVQAAIKDRDIAARTAGKQDGVSDDEILDILSKMIKQRNDSIAAYEQGGRLELAEQEREEIAIIQEFLPKQLSEAEMQDAIKGVISDLGAESLKDMGKVMGELKKRYAGQMDFAKAGAVVKAQLGG